jgi:hypothetical protein
VVDQRISHPKLYGLFVNTGQKDFGHFKQSPLDCVIPAWSAGIQADMDVSGSILANLDAGYPCRHDEVRIFIFCGERRIITHFVEMLSFTSVLSTIIYTHMLNRWLTTTDLRGAIMLYRS